MADFVINNILSILGGGAVIITGLASWLGTVWSSRIAIREKAEQQKYLDELKRKHEKEIGLLKHEHETYLEQLRNQLLIDSERLKVKLKKSEFLFEKEFEATSEFFSLNLNIQPKPSSYFDDSDDVINDQINFRERVESILSTISPFINKYGVVLDEDTRTSLKECIVRCNELIELEFMGDNWAGHDLRKVFNTLEEIDCYLIDKLKKQIVS
ncbi:hypothetical protein [Vibrio sp. C8]